MMVAHAPTEVVLVEILELSSEQKECDDCGSPLLEATTPAAKKLPLEIDAKVVLKDGKSFVDRDRVHFARCKPWKGSGRRFKRGSKDLSAAQDELRKQVYRNRCLREVVGEARRRLAAGEAPAELTKWIDEAMQLAERGLSPLGARAN